MASALIPEPSNLQFVMLAGGVLYALLAVTVWLMLHRRHDAWSVGLWSCGSLALALGLTLVGQRGAIPDWMGYQLANGLLQWSLALKLWALRRDLGLPLHVGWLSGATLLANLSFHLATLTPAIGPRVVVGTLTLVIGLVALAWHAHLAGRRTPSPSGAVLAWAEGIAAAGVLIRMVGLLEAWPQSLAWASMGQFALLLAMAAFAAVYSNLGYLGMVLDRVAASESQARAEQVAAVTRRDEALQATEALRTLLAQRNRLVAERDHLLQVLAHEIRQPVHNASGALQAAATALQKSQALESKVAEAPLLLAQNMLGNMQSVLDNALAGAALLTRSEALVTQDVDLDVLVQVALGDLPPEQRQRVQVDWQTTMRSAELEPGLVRLALRNLLRNAFAHGGSGVAVRLVLAESARPPKLTMAVVDTGPSKGAAALAASAGLRETDPGQRAAPTRGMGLFIAERVMTLHNGELRLADNQPHGLVASLVFGLPADDEASLMHH